MPRLTRAAVLALVLLAACGTDAVTDAPSDTAPSAIGSPGPVPDGPAPSGSPPGSGTAGERPSVDDVRLGLEVVADGLESPVFVTPLAGTPDLLVLEQRGRVQRVGPDGAASVWLDIEDRVGSAGNEQGLLGLALHPDFPDDGRVFVYYTGRDGTSTLDRLRATVAAADATSRFELLSIPQPAGNHNGGMLAFHGERDLLYLGLGDGGGGGDQFGNGQDPSTLLGTILRLEVNGDTGYAIPDDNPFADGGDGAPEVWVYGLRNPWRFTFDGDRVFIGDVGQGSFEEISTVTVADGGANLGWPITEGEACFAPHEGCDRAGLTLPIVTYETGPGGTCSVLQGYAYRGARLPALDGHVFYSDHCAGFLRSFRLDSDATAVDERDWTGQVGVIEGATSFGLDHDGELLITARDGRVLRLVSAG